MYDDPNGHWLHIAIGSAIGAGFAVAGLKGAAVTYLGGKLLKPVVKQAKKVIKPVVGLSLDTVLGKGAIRDKVANVASLKFVKDRVNDVATSLKRNLDKFKPSSLGKNLYSNANSKLASTTANNVKNNILNNPRRIINNGTDVFSIRTSGSKSTSRPKVNLDYPVAGENTGLTNLERMKK